MENPSFPPRQGAPGGVDKWLTAALILVAGTLASGFEGGDVPLKTELITEHASIQPEGSTRVGVYFRIEDGWHIYAKEPGDAGLPTTVTWVDPDPWIATFGPLRYPKPDRFIDPGEIQTFGYSGAVVLASELKVTSVKPGDVVPFAATANLMEGPIRMPDSIHITATVKWLACKDICVPGSANLSLTLPVSADPPVFSAHAQLFEQLPN